MRRSIYFLFLSLLLLSLNACGGNSEAQQADQEEIIDLEEASAEMEESAENIEDAMADLEVAIDSLEILFPEEDQ